MDDVADGSRPDDLLREDILNGLVPSRQLMSRDPDFWRYRVGVMFETEFAPDVPFHVRVDSTQLGRLIISEMQTSRFHYARRIRKMRTDMLDHLMVRVDDFGDRSELRIIDMGQEIAEFRQISARNTSIIVPRDVMSEIVKDPARLNGVIVPDAGIELLKHFMSALPRYAPGLRNDQAEGVAGTLMNLMAATLSGKSDGVERGRQALAQAALQRAQDYIRRHIGDPALSPDRIAAEAALSRASLYRLFEPLGGVAAYIRERRLDYAYRLLRDPDEKRFVAVISDALGFSSEAHFSRVFKQRFGLSPREVRLAAQENSAVPPVYLSRENEHPFVKWLHGL
jgi:AraC-like DNA-binding protein